MSSRLAAIRDRLRKQVLSAPAHLLDPARARHPVLASYADVDAILACMEDRSHSTCGVRDQLAKVLVTEHRQTRELIWASMLLVVFYPLLSNLRFRVRADELPSDERDQLVISAFLEAVEELPTGDRADRIALRLKQRTTRRVFGHVVGERLRASRLVPACEAEASEVVELPATDEPLEDAVVLDLGRLLDYAARRGLAEWKLELLTNTVLSSERLRQYVARVSPDDEVARVRLYGRLRRQRSRVLTELRFLLRREIEAALGRGQPARGLSRGSATSGRPTSAGSKQPRIQTVQHVQCVTSQRRE